jgi:hypothetical protein
MADFNNSMTQELVRYLQRGSAVTDTGLAA